MSEGNQGIVRGMFEGRGANCPGNIRGGNVRELSEGDVGANCSGMSGRMFGANVWVELSGECLEGANCPGNIRGGIVRGECGGKLFGNVEKNVWDECLGNCQGNVWRGQIAREISGEEMSEELSEGMWKQIVRECPEKRSGRMSENVRGMFGGGKLSGRIVSNFFSFN